MNALMSLMFFYSSLHHLDPRLTMSVVQVESRFNVNARGALGEVGLMQLRPEYHGLSEKQLRQPSTNIRLGVEQLAQARKACEPKLGDGWVVCFNTGIARGLRLRHPTNQTYYKKVQEAYSTLPNIRTGYVQNSPLLDRF